MAAPAQTVRAQPATVRPLKSKLPPVELPSSPLFLFFFCPHGKVDARNVYKVIRRKGMQRGTYDGEQGEEQSGGDWGGAIMEFDRLDLRSSQCFLRDSLRMAKYGIFAGSLLFLLLAPRVVHLAFARLRQPRLVSQMIVGIIFGNSNFIRSLMDDRLPSAFEVLLAFTVMAYMFVTGLEMDVRTMFLWRRREVVLSYAGVAATLAVFLGFYPVFDQGKFTIAEMHNWGTALVMGAIFSSTSSPVLNRLTTDLKIGKSDIGRLAVKAGLHNDMFTTTFLCLVNASMRNDWILKNGNLGELDGRINRRLFGVLFTVLGCSVEAIVIFKVMPRYMSWIEDRNPSGKRIKGFDLAITALFTAGMCLFCSMFVFSYRTTAFLIGLFLPREGRIARQLVRKLNFYLTTIGIPLYLCDVGLSTRVGAWNGVTVGLFGQTTQWSWGDSLAKLAVFFTLSSLGKVIGTFFAASHYGFRPPEAIALGLLLNVKGMFHIFLIYGAKESHMLNDNTFLVMLCVIMGSIMYIPLVVAMIVWRARRMQRRRLMGLQWHDPASELRMVVGIHGPQNVPAVINIIETTRGQAQAPLVVYAMDLIELTERAASTLVHEQGGLEAVTVKDEGITETCDAITHTLDSYVQECGEGLTIRRLLTVSSYSNMHRDICNGAQDGMSALIILPFHRSQRVDGGMDSGHPGHRQVNEKVLQRAPCSVGILVDRGLAGPNTTSVSHTTKQVAVIFIGGSDDREALIFAGRMAQHPAVQMTAIRFIPEPGAGDDSRPSALRGHVLALINRQERETQLDDACVAEFYEQHVAKGGVRYMEEYVTNGAETVATLRAMEGLYNLFLVGAAGSRHSQLTAGLGDWEECPELGPIGDVLASSDFSVTASVLIIQQHSIRKKLKNLDDTIEDEFAVTYKV